jgi:DNA-binding response OmpR family regulator
MNLLLIEDNQHLQRIFYEKFRREGFNVTVADDGRQGLQCAAQIRPDVILLDIMMPNMDGFEVLTHLRADPNLSSIPAFVLSNRATSSDVQHALALGARQFFPKGISALEDIARLIRATCGFKKVLICTNSPTLAEPIVSALAHPRLLCAVVTVLAEIVNAANRDTPEVIVLDARVPNAVTLLQQLKTHPAAKSIPVIAVGNPGQPLNRADESIDSARLVSDLRPAVMKRLGLQDTPVPANPSSAPVPATA